MSYNPKIMIVLCFLFFTCISIYGITPSGEINPYVEVKNGKFYVYYDDTSAFVSIYRYARGVQPNFLKVYSKSGKLLKPGFKTNDYVKLSNVCIYSFGQCFCYKHNDSFYLFNSIYSCFIVSKSVNFKLETRGDFRFFSGEINEKNPQQIKLPNPKLISNFKAKAACVTDKYIAIVAEEGLSIPEKHKSKYASIYLYENSNKLTQPKRYKLGYPNQKGEIAIIPWKSLFLVAWAGECRNPKTKPTVPLYLSVIDPLKDNLTTIVLKKEIHYQTSVSANVIDDTICVAYHQGPCIDFIPSSKIVTLFLELTELVGGR